MDLVYLPKGLELNEGRTGAEERPGMTRLRARARPEVTGSAANL